MTRRLLWLLNIRYLGTLSQVAPRQIDLTWPLPQVAPWGIYNEHVSMRATFFGFYLSSKQAFRVLRPLFSHFGQIVYE